MHGLREELLDLQIKSLGIPLQKVHFPKDVSMKTYDEIMFQSVSKLKAEAYTHCVFGDIFLQDLRSYREEKLGEIGIQGVFPLWKRDTKNYCKSLLNLVLKQ